MKQTMSINTNDFKYICQLVYEQSAVVLQPEKTYLAELYLQPIAETAGYASIGELVNYLQTQPLSELHSQVVESLVTNETSFFRDRYPFEALKEYVLPELIGKRSRERSLNIWCAACSNGQEPYSIAMLIKEYFPILSKWSLKLIASDFSHKVLAKAKQGYYNQLEIQRGLPSNLRDRYFQELDNNWQIHNEIIQMVEFRQFNLVESWITLPKQDVIFLRNVLIYFDTATKKDLLKKIKHKLNPDGYLFLGNAETTIHLDSAFTRVQFDKAICYRLNK
ncbi:CheR methyltransferase, SAM binding domain protein [Calothrix brevissima NIES-22]|nr:CheR methyltransferase, SAM binding domain protein [Calothrix brevissima NIES-22]